METVEMSEELEMAVNGIARAKENIIACSNHAAEWSDDPEEVKYWTDSTAGWVDSLVSWTQRVNELTA